MPFDECDYTKDPVPKDTESIVWIVLALIGSGLLFCCLAAGAK